MICTDTRNCPNYEKYNKFDPYGKACVHRDTHHKCNLKYAPIRSLSKEDNQEIYEFAMKRSKEMLTDIAPLEPNGGGM